MKIVPYILLLLILLSQLSCQSLVSTFELEDRASLIVLNGSFAKDSLMQIHVSRSTGINNLNNTEPPDGVQLDLYKEGTLLGSFTQNEHGWHQFGEYTPEVEVDYLVTAYANNMEEVQSSFYIPEKPEIIKIDTAWVTERDIYLSDGSEAYVFEMDIIFKDKHPRRDFYAIFANYYQMELTYNTVTGDVMDTSWVLAPIKLLVSSDPKLEVAFYNNYYYNPVIDTDQTATFFMLSDRYFNQEQTSVKIKINRYAFDYRGLEASKSSEDKMLIELSLMAVDENYFTYAKSKAAYREAAGNPLAEPVSIYSSVENGYGVLTGFSTHTVSMEANIGFIYPKLEDEWQ